jgi:hypothetical protein
MLMRRWMLPILLLIVLSACQTSVPIAPTAAPTVPLPTSTATLVPLASPEQLTAWKFYDPRDPTLKDLIIKDGDSYRLDPTWKVKEILFLLNASSRSSAIFDYQTLKRNGDYFEGEGKSIPVAQVQTLVDSINQLHSSQMLLGNTGGHDRYANWQVELIGEDGQAIQLIYATEGGVEPAPWNIQSNGRLYVQYTNRLSESLAKLAERYRSMVHPARSPDSVSFGTVGASSLRSGFSGLLPLARAFKYQVNPEQNTLTGQISGVHVSQLTQAWKGTVTSIQQVVLTEPAGQISSCTIEPQLEADVIGAHTTWNFTCTPRSAIAGQRYHYPIEIQAEIMGAGSITMTGELFGIWDTNTVSTVSSLPQEIQTAFEARADIRDLLQDHVVVQTDYQAEISSTLPSRGKLAGEAVLGGSLLIDGQPVRYTVSTPFTIENGQVTHWALTRSALEKMRQDISQLPLTRQMVKALSDAQLNMWYFGKGGVPHDWVNLQNPNMPALELILPTCDVNNEQVLPREGAALQAFGFNHDWLYWGYPDFVLVDGKPVVYNLSWDAQVSGQNQAVYPELPVEFKQLLRPFEEVSMQAAFGGHARALRLTIPSDAPPAEQTAYKNLIDSLPGQATQIDETTWDVLYTTFVVNDHGELEVAACQ